MPKTTIETQSEWRILWRQNPEADIKWLAGVFHCTWPTCNKYVYGDTDKGGIVVGFANETTEPIDATLEPVDATPAEPVTEPTAEPMNDLIRFVRAFESRAIEWHNDKLMLESTNDKLRTDYEKIQTLNSQLDIEIQQLKVTNYRLNADNTALALAIRNRSKLSLDVIANSPLLRLKDN